MSCLNYSLFHSLFFVYIFLSVPFLLIILFCLKYRLIFFYISFFFFLFLLSSLMSVSPLPAIMIYWQSVLHFDVRLLPLPLCSHFTHASHHLYHHFLLPLSSQLFFFSTFSLFSLISFTCSPLTVLSFIMYSLSLSFFFFSLSQTYKHTDKHTDRKWGGGKSSTTSPPPPSYIFF